ncbi:type II toxin-antitoxin system PemK/MazF family toxin [Citricoccus sp. SGAir0253]|uniref:type II toxin-antitoxin system PemK/MazF family toxin n=1 Tax=Citricoccus sp. SGAir0253 TaxID=2567881 RepID=UPI0010CD355D|nr:type II toxin-antitoxin system PemK/MazF family toxin [Citricoccus sp. SGAir0253]QCU78003.1 type II toxin-antitoxin system PemK/MazF family toxin [Citricoccus sp. SGAir0253]
MAMDLHRLLAAARRVAGLVRELRRAPSPGSRGRDGAAPARRPGRPPGSGTAAPYPGDFHGRARVEYDPVPGPEAGPGEVVWTWVPFEELDGRGKDRPVLVVGRDGRHLLALQLTSRDHHGGGRRDEEYLDVGTGAWDARGRASEVRLDRVVRVDPRDVRREGAVLAPGTFDRVRRALRDRHGWA